jgi:hypothetical protein
MILTFRPLPSIDVFRTAPSDRLANPFRASYSDTLSKLDDELGFLDASEAWLQVALADPVRHVRLDGQLHAKAVTTHPGVVLTMVTVEHGTLVYSCDRFAGRWPSDPPDWQINLRAITLGLADLRRLDRYGIADRGQQYAGFRELGSGTAMEGGAVHDRSTLAAFLGSAAGWEVPPDPDDDEQIEAAFRQAARAHHPDHGGRPQMMAYLNTARDALVGALR